MSDLSLNDSPSSSPQSDLLQQELSGEAVTVRIAGQSYPLAYGMAAVIVYKRETARIERSRPQLEQKDPQCLCGAARSAHVGADLIILDAEKRLLCWGFRAYDPLQGDSLYGTQSWKRIDLDVDPERWVACLWAGLHQLLPDGKTWRAPMTLAELSARIPLGAAAHELSVRMVLAVRQSSAQPKEASAPNAGAPAEQNPPALNANTPKVNPISAGSGPAPVVASAIPAANS